MEIASILAIVAVAGVVGVAAVGAWHAGPDLVSEDRVLRQLDYGLRHLELERRPNSLYALWNGVSIRIAFDGGVRLTAVADDAPDLGIGRHGRVERGVRLGLPCTDPRLVDFFVGDAHARIALEAALQLRGFELQGHQATARSGSKPEDVERDVRLLVSSLRTLMETEAAPWKALKDTHPLAWAGGKGLHGSVYGRAASITRHQIRVRLRRPLGCTLQASGGGKPLAIGDLILDGRLATNAHPPELAGRLGQDRVRGRLLELLAEFPDAEVGPEYVMVVSKPSLTPELTRVLETVVALADALDDEGEAV